MYGSGRGSAGVLAASERRHDPEAPIAFFSIFDICDP